MKPLLSRKVFSTSWIWQDVRDYYIITTSTRAIKEPRIWAEEVPLNLISTGIRQLREI
jgi:hypothetical protein